MHVSEVQGIVRKYMTLRIRNLAACYVVCVCVRARACVRAYVHMLMHVSSQHLCLYCSTLSEIIKQTHSCAYLTIADWSVFMHMFSGNWQCVVYFSKKMNKL
jgi:hypothetical protein